MPGYAPQYGYSTLLNHLGEGKSDHHAHVTPIYQTSTFGQEDIASLNAILVGEKPGYLYTRLNNPNFEIVAQKIAALEAIDLVRAQPDVPLQETVAGLLCASGMGAITAALMACLETGQQVLAQRGLYGGTFGFLTNIAPRIGIEVVWLDDYTEAGWTQALEQHPDVALLYAETPINPTMEVVDLNVVADLAHERGIWLIVDNTFATPYCQRPLTLGADVVVHSTSKYLAGHGTLIGGAIVSPHVDFMREQALTLVKTLGLNPSPFDAWLTNMGLKTFELRMERHCENARELAQFLDQHPNVKRVHYPGLESHPQHDLAREQMACFGGMLSFDVGGEARVNTVIERIGLATFSGSLGNVDTLIAHPASMSHRGMPPETRRELGIGDGLLRLSVGVENVADLKQDLARALA